MKRKKFLLGAILALSVSVLASCQSGNATSSNSSQTNDASNPTQIKDVKNISDFKKAVNQNMNNIYIVNTTAIMTDNNEVVYKNETSVSVTDRETLSGSISVNKYTLNKAFKLEKRTTVDTFSNLDVNKLFAYQLNESYFTEYKLENGVLTGNVKTDSASLFLNDSTLKVTNNPSFSFTLTNNYLSSLSVSYESNGKVVTVNSSYIYY